MAETGGEQTGVVRIDVEVETKSMQAGLAAAESKMSRLGKQAEAEFNRASSANKRYATSLLRQAHTIGMTRAEQLAYNAQLKLGGDLGKKISEIALQREAALRKEVTSLGGATQAFAGSSKSARELQFAMRGLPAQFTDIVTGIASGQRPMMLLLQQGGQIKDMFGGIRPALAAVGSQLLKLVNPYTAVAAAAGALIFAWKQAEDEAFAFQKALLTSGNAAGMTVGKLDSLADAIARAGATQGQAIEAVQKVAESGRFIGDTFSVVAEAAARMNEATGQSIDDTIRKFESIAKDPVDALLKLNETEHFLTRAQLDRVQALIGEGREQDAAAESARIYAHRLDDIATAADNARPHLARMWSDSKDALSSLWEKTKDYAEFLAAVAEKQQQMPWWQRVGPMGAIGAFRALYSAEPVAPAAPAPAGATVDSSDEEAARKARESLAKFAAPDERLRRVAKDAEQAFLKAIYGISDPATIAKYAAQMNAQIADARDGMVKAASSGGSGRGGFDADRYRERAIDDLQKEIGAEAKLADERARSALAVKAYQNSLDDMLATRQAQITLQARSIGMGKLEAQQRGQLIRIDEDYNRKADQLRRQQQNTTSAIDKAAYAQQLDDLAAYHDKRVQLEIAGFAAEKAARADWHNGLASAMQDLIDQGQDVAAMTANAFTDAFGAMNDALVKFVVTGKLDLKSLADSIIEDLTRIGLRMAESQLLHAVLEGLSFNFMGGLARGGAFDESGTIPFATGGIVSAPTLFKFAGGTGMMGEAGPEAIMPLARGPDGKLGVRGGGGGNTTVIVENHADGKAQVQQSKDGLGNDVIRVIVGQAVGEVDKRIARGGSTGQIMQQAFGLSRRGVPVVG